MNQRLPKIVFFGTEEHSLITLKKLVLAGFNVACVVTKPDMKSGRGHRLIQPPVKQFAINHGIAVLQPQKMLDIEHNLRQLTPAIGVLVAYGKIIPQSIIDIFSPAIVNIHPSLLPKWRGPSPIEATIYNQDSQTGVSIMKLDKRMDAGPVYRQITKKLDGNENKTDLYNELFNRGSDLLIDELPAIISGELQPKPQDESQATYCKLLSKADSLLDPQAMTAEKIDAHIRAHLGFPRSRLQVNNDSLIITKAKASAEQISQIAIKCQDGNFINVMELIAPSGKTMSSTDYLNGYLAQK